MSGTQANVLTNPAVSNSGNVDNLLIERFTGMVNEVMRRKEQLIKHFKVQTVENTNQVTSKSIGDSDLQVLIPGQEPEATGTQFDNHSLVVDTVVLARNTMALLHKIQSDIEVQQKLAETHASKIIKLKDESLMTQIIRGSEEATGRVSGHFGGYRVFMEAAGDDVDPVKFLEAFEKCVLRANEVEIENEMLYFAVPWKQYYVLMDNDDLTNGDYVPGGAGANGSKVQGKVLKAYNIPILPTNRIIQTATETGTHHKLSNAQNGYRYDTRDIDAGCIGVLFGTEALLCGSSVSLSFDAYYSKRMLTYFLDTYESWGAIPDRFEYCNAIFAFDNTITPSTRDQELIAIDQKNNKKKISL